MTQFNPNAASSEDSGIFGLPFGEANSGLVFLPVPWEVTTSYGGGTSKGPQAILEASRQVDLFDTDVFRPYEAGMFMLPESEEVLQWNTKGRSLAKKIIEAAGELEGHPQLIKDLDEVNRLGHQLNEYVYHESRKIIQAGKILGVVGGDHSVPFGAIRAATEKHGSIGILHFDAHSDTRKAFEGFTWSHASIMYNVLEKIPQVTQLTQVGIRDFCEEEMEYIQSQKSRISLFLDRTLARKKFSGTSWDQISKDIVSRLPEKVWVSFDIDGLDPRFCPHTGTPVPGGLDFQEANHILSTLARSGREIVGFDLNEVAPDLNDESNEWDANVGARLLYKLSAWTLASQKKARLLD